MLAAPRQHAQPKAPHTPPYPMHPAAAAWHPLTSNVVPERHRVKALQYPHALRQFLQGLLQAYVEHMVLHPRQGGRHLGGVLSVGGGRCAQHSEGGRQAQDLPAGTGRNRAVQAATQDDAGPAQVGLMCT